MLQNYNNFCKILYFFNLKSNFHLKCGRKMRVGGPHDANRSTLAFSRKSLESAMRLNEASVGDFTAFHGSHDEVHKVERTVGLKARADFHICQLLWVQK